MDIQRHPQWDPYPLSASSLHVTSIPPLTRTPSPSMLSDTSHSFTGPVSPLPSPLLAPQPDIVDQQLPATPGSKTNAFFGSSWKLLIPKPATPKKNSIGSIDIPKDGTVPSTPVDIPTLDQETQSSQTIHFFNKPSNPTSPPPSIRQFSPDEEKPDSAALRLQLARLSALEEQSASHHSRSSSHSSSGHAYGFTKPPRDFVYWTPESSDLSRSSSRSSVSGVRRDFAFTPINPSSSYSPSNHSPLARMREFEELLTPKPTDVDPEGRPGRRDSARRESGWTRDQEAQTPRERDQEPQLPEHEVQTPREASREHHHNSHPLVRRETQRNKKESQLENGMIIGDEAPLVLVRLLGKGAFSSVWLARDIEDRLIPPGPRQRRRKSVSTARKQGDAVPGLRPATRVGTRLGVLNELDGEGAVLPEEPRGRMLENPSKVGKLVAVKMLDRTLCDVNDRTRISFVREVEVLRHISHPSIVAFLHAFTISTYHCVVLEHIGGGELFELINSDENHARMTAPLLRRMWGELCRAVGWLHGVAIVHRDIKLENILLTVNPFLQSEPIELHTLPQPLVKLTDFGLARFIDPSQPMLTTRCGSECYAAPELVLGSAYDGRQTDAWACGIVLYALVVRSLPFDAPPGTSGGSSRRKYLVRIAKAEYTWPEDETEAGLASDDLKSVVARLLVRDPAKRAGIVELWDEPFMRGEGAPSPPWRVAARRAALEYQGGGSDEEEDEDGMLVDAHDIDSIASQELL